MCAHQQYPAHDPPVLAGPTPNVGSRSYICSNTAATTLGGHMNTHDDVMTVTMGEAFAACRGSRVDPVTLVGRVLKGEREAKDALHALLRIHLDRQEQPLHIG